MWRHSTKDGGQAGIDQGGVDGQNSDGGSSLFRLNQACNFSQTQTAIVEGKGIWYNSSYSLSSLTQRIRTTSVVEV